jgi:hypothetical protein
MLSIIDHDLLDGYSCTGSVYLPRRGEPMDEDERLDMIDAGLDRYLVCASPRGHDCDLVVETVASLDEALAWLADEADQGGQAVDLYDLDEGRRVAFKVGVRAWVVE